MSNHLFINHYSGEQYRTISCYWGNKKCIGFTNRKDKEHVCVDINIKNRFCENQYSGNWNEPPSYVNLTKFDQTRGGVGQGEIM